MSARAAPAGDPAGADPRAIHLLPFARGKIPRQCRGVLDPRTTAMGFGPSLPIVASREDSESASASGLPRGEKVRPTAAADSRKTTARASARVHSLALQAELR